MDGVALDDLITEIRTAKEVSIYQRQALPGRLLELLRDLRSSAHPEVEIVAEDLSDVTYLRQLYSWGCKLFYGVGLPCEPFIFLNARQGFVIEDNLAVALRSLSAKDAENLYYRLLWRRFGHAVSLTGAVRERDPEQSLFCLEIDSDSETWCRLRTAGAGIIPEVGEKVTVFAWEKWVSHILEVIHLQFLPSE